MWGSNMLEDPWVVFQLEAAIVLLATLARTLTRKYVTYLEARLFLLEMLATSQLCACCGLLRVLADVEPKPSVYLTHTCSFLLLHLYLTLTENTCNPAWVVLYILREGISMRLGKLKIAAQFIGAFLATLIFPSFLAPDLDTGICESHLQTHAYATFFTELVISAMVQLILLYTQFQELHVRITVLAATLTVLTYIGLLFVFPLLFIIS